LYFCHVLKIIYLISFTAYSQRYKGGHEKWEYVLEESGDFLQLAIPISAGILTVLKKDPKGTENLALSYGATILVTYSLKKIIYKQRPEGRYRFDSFPSGHTSSAFSGASFIQRRYGWDYGVPAYLLAGLVGVSRTESPIGYHDFWDVLGGAAIGIGSTYLFTKPLEKGVNIEMNFAANNSYKLLTLKYKF